MLVESEIAKSIVISGLNYMKIPQYANIEKLDSLEVKIWSVENDDVYDLVNFIFRIQVASLIIKSSL